MIYALIMIIFFLAYLSTMLTIMYFTYRPKRRRRRTPTSRMMQPVQQPVIQPTQRIEEAEKPREIGVVQRPDAKRLAYLKDKSKQEAHDGFMGTLDNVPELLEARKNKPIQPGKKGYVAP